MGEFITNIFNAFLELMRQFRAVDVLDIVVVAFLIYSLIKLVRETSAEINWKVTPTPAIFLKGQSQSSR